MKILYDGYTYQVQEAGGINRYFAEVISRLPPSFIPCLLDAPQRERNFPAHPRLKSKNFRLFPPYRISRRVRDWSWKYWVLKDYVIAHPTYYMLSDGFSYSDYKRPVVVTVYDMTYAKYSKLMGGSEFVLHWQRKAIERADAIICISESTRQDMLEFHPAAEAKSRVIYLGSSLGMSKSESASPNKRSPYFLYVGSREGYKNFPFLIRAFAKVCSLTSDVRLLVAGAPPSSLERWSVHGLKIEDRVDFLEHPPENLLGELYRHSLALLYPSFTEGFGIPPLEAMQCGTIAIASNTSSLPEIVADAGILLDPTDGDAWLECMLSVINGTLDRTALVAKGRQRAGQFSWQQTAEQTVAVYRELL